MDTNEPIEGTDSSEKESASRDALAANELDQKINELAEKYLGCLRRGEPGNIEELVKRHPEFAPHLEARLKLFAAIFRATRLPTMAREDQTADATVDFSKFASATDPVRDFAFRIDCPHCGNHMQVVGTKAVEVTCGKCGSSIRVGTNRSGRAISSIPAPLPEQLSHFRIVRVLGEGAFGIVYLAEDLQLDNRQVALKIPRHGYFVTVDEERRFFREARNVARLRHRNIAQVLDVSKDPNTPYIVSEFIDGLTLRDRARGGNLTHREIAELLSQVSDAVEFAHQNKVIHRDLKTSNIMVDHDNRAFVVDFGLSRRDDAEITMTIEGAIVGTIQYMSPEQADGKQAEVGPRSDIYSMGVILYELLCNELPFHGTKRMMIDQVMCEEPRSPRKLNESVPRDLETITLKAMAKRPIQRYSSAQEFGDDLRHWLRGEPIKYRPIGALGRYWRWCRRHPTTASLSAAIAALMLACTAISLGWAIEQSRITRVAEAARRQSEGRQYELLMQNGSNALDGNDLTNAALWLSEALAIKDTRVNRIRIGMVQDRLPKLSHLWTTGAPLDKIEFNEDGTRLFASSLTGRVQVFDTLSRKRLFDQDLPSFSRFEFSPSGDKIAMCGGENHAQLWDVESGRLVKQLEHSQIVRSTDFHASGQLLATGGDDSYARIWSASDGAFEAEYKFEGLRVIRVAFVPDSDLIALVTHKEHELSEEIHLWDHAKKTLVASGMKHADHIQSIDFADGGKRLCSASTKGDIRVWDTASGKQIGESLQLPFSRRVLFGGSADRVVSISYDFEVQFWNLGSRKREGPQIRRAASFASCDQDRSNRLLALGGGDGTVNIYWCQTGTQACSILRNSESASAIAFHPDGRRLAIGGRNGMLQIWDLAGASPKSHVFQHAGAVRNALFSPDGKRCLTIGLEGKAFLWNVNTGQQMGAALEHSGGITDCAVSFDGKIFATASNDQTVKLWDGHTGGPIGKSLVHGSPVKTLAISPNAKQLVAGCFDGSVILWKIEDFPVSATVAGNPVFMGKHKSQIMSVAYNPQGSLIASASADGEVRCWDVLTGNQKSGTSQDPSVFYCVFMADGKHLIICGSNGGTYNWNVADGEIPKRLECAGTVRSARLLASDGRFMTNETGGRTRIWRGVETPVQMEVIQHASIDTTYFSDMNPLASILAIAGGSVVLGSDKAQAGAAVLWDITELRQLGPPLVHLGPVRRVYFDVTGTKLLTASEDHTARLWSLVENDLPTEDAIRISNLYAQSKRDSIGRLRTQPPDEQLAEFELLSTKYPNLFNCDANEIELWNEDARRLHETKSIEASENLSGT